MSNLVGERRMYPPRNESSSQAGVVNVSLVARMQPSQTVAGILLSGLLAQTHGRGVGTEPIAMMSSASEVIRQLTTSRWCKMSLVCNFALKSQFLGTVAQACRDLHPFNA